MASILEKMRENTFIWLGCILRSKETEAVRVINGIYVEGQRGKVRSKYGRRP